MKIPFRSFLLLLALPVSVATLALSPEEIDKAVRAAKDAPKNQTLNKEAADLLKEAGRYNEAIQHYLKSGNAGNLGIAESYFYLYNYDKAEEYLEKYLAKRSKAEAAKDMDFSYGDGSETIDWTDYLSSRIDLGRSMLDRVEKIQVIDSVNVPSDTFFKFLTLAKSAGSLKDESAVENILSQRQMQQLGVTNLWSPVYVSDGGEDMIWYASSDDGNSKLFESSRLSDGKWDSPKALFDYESIFGDKNGSWVAYPFLMSDGVTLYFAADGEASLGELDIFISRRDEDGFLQPSNIGMPYNSPFNDYLYAIDEETGTGWWVSDRNMIEDSVTIYTFIPQDLRINYPVDTPDLASYARIKSIASTQDSSADYTQLRDRIKAAAMASRTEADKKEEFRFALPGGKIYTTLGDFKNPQAKAAMENYLSEKKSYDLLKRQLNQLRATYRNGDVRISSDILDMERTLEHKRSELLRLKNQVVSSEM